MREGLGRRVVADLGWVVAGMWLVVVVVVVVLVVVVVVCVGGRGGGGRGGSPRMQGVGLLCFARAPARSGSSLMCGLGGRVAVGLVSVVVFGGRWVVGGRRGRQR